MGDGTFLCSLGGRFNLFFYLHEFLYDFDCLRHFLLEFGEGNIIYFFVVYRGCSLFLVVGDVFVRMWAMDSAGYSNGVTFSL